MELFIYIAIGLLLTRIWYVGKYFRLYNTLIHEIGHVLMSLFTKGKVYHVKLNQDASGLAYTGSRGKFSQVLVSIAGYPFASFIAYCLFYLMKEQKFEYVLFGIVSVLVISMLFWVRNWFGFFWLLLAVVVTTLMIMYGTDRVTEIYTYILVSIIFTESIFSTIDLIKIISRDKDNAGDASNLKRSTGIHQMFWGVLFLGVALFTGFKVIMLYFG